MPDADPFSQVLEAASFAARAHRHHMRKDKETPYVSHVFRVCLTARHVFGIDDPRILQAALLHDTIEDTNTDFDDIAEKFGKDVAEWVSLLSKDTRKPDDERERKYIEDLANAPWQVQVCKLADIHDNLHDSGHLTGAARGRTLKRTRLYLDGMKAKLRPEAEAAYVIVDRLHRDREAPGKV